MTSYRLAGPSSSPEDAVDARRSVRALRQILGTLSEEARFVFAATELEELSREEIARLLGVPANTVASRLGAARAKVRAGLLAREGDKR